MAKKSRDKGNRGKLEAKALLEVLGHRVVVCHGTGMEDIEGGDLWVDKSQFVQVKYGLHVPKKLYSFLEKCPVALVRRVGPKEPGLPWVKLELIKQS